MKDLPTLLEQAAGSEPIGFDHHDVRSQADRLRRRQRIVPVAAVMALAIVGTLAWVRLGANDGPSSITTGGSPDGSELTSDRWVAFAVSRVTTFGGSPWVELESNGRLNGYDGCDNFERSWALADGVLQTSGGSQTHRECSPGPGTGLIELLDGGAEVAHPPQTGVTHPPDADDDLVLTAAASATDPTGPEEPELRIWFRSFASLGAIPSAEGMRGTWVQSRDDPRGMSVTFGTADTESVSRSGCIATATWHLEGDVLEQRDHSGGCPLLGAGDAPVRIRLEKGRNGSADRLHVASASSVDRYTRQNP